MTVRMRLRRWARAQGKRRAAARTKRSTAAGSRRREQQTSGASQLRFLRLTVCGALFVSLVLLKLVLPGNLSAFRGTLAQWLVRDADFTEAFSAIATRSPRPNDSRSPSAMPTSPCLAAAVCRTPRRSAAGRRSHSRTEQTRRMPQPSPCRIMCSTRSRRCPFPMCHRSTAR